MLPIEPLVTDTKSVEMLLQWNQKRCRARLLTAADVVNSARAAYAMLARLGISRRRALWSLFELTPPKLCIQYNHGRETGHATVLRLVLSRKGWRVVQIERQPCCRVSPFRCSKEARERRYRLILSGAARQFLTRFYRHLLPPKMRLPAESDLAAIWTGVLERRAEMAGMHVESARPCIVAEEIAL